MQTQRPYIPQDVSEIIDHLAMIMLAPASFRDDFFTERTVETVFYEPNEGLRLIRLELGEERFTALTSLSDRMRVHFEADPEDKNGEANKARRLIPEMQILLIGRRL